MNGPPSRNHFSDHENALWDADPHAYTDEQCDLLAQDECDEVMWPSENDHRFLVLQWFGAMASMEAMPYVR